MILDLSAEELEQVTDAYARYQLGEFDAESMMELSVRVRVAAFVCIALVHLNPDGVWAGPFAQLARTVMPDARDSSINNLGTDLREYHLRVTTSFGGERYEVFFLTQQLADLIGAVRSTAEDEEGPEYFIELLDRLDGNDSDGWGGTIAGLIVQHGCVGASRMVQQMQGVLDPESVSR